jgi:hypothetical protein
MPPIRLAGCRETQAWTYAKTDPNRRFNHILLYRQKSSRVRIPTEPQHF